MQKRWPRLQGESVAVRQLEEAIARVADFDCSVLITGETGCGKEEVARAIHAAGPRRNGPFVAINCGGLVASLAESHLFGHEKGSFTGASGPSLGAFRSANGGIVFLDEIGELPLDMQPKLLQVLQRWEISPVGSTKTHPIDVQVIAATNRDLEAEVDTGEFREDLFYRLNTIHLTVPPLRARPEDIPRFLEHFSAHFAREYARPRWMPDQETLGRFLRHPWPGNVRQLAQTIQRIYVFEDRIDTVLAEVFAQDDASTVPEQTAAAPMTTPQAVPRIGEADDPVAAVTAPPVLPATPAVEAALVPGDGSRGSEPPLPVFNLDALRRMAVRQALAATDGHRKNAADLLGVSLNTMTRLVAEACPDATAKTGRKRGAAPRQPR
jgi:DNA-binding NtrC family response regulator